MISRKKHNQTAPEQAETRSPREADENASLILDPAFNGVVALKAVLAPEDKESGVADLGALFKELRAISESLTSGDLTRPEEIAMTHISILDRLFSRLLEIAFLNLEQGHFESLMRVALKAQSQCARTIETLATLKNPAIIAKQLNLANQQVVNNGSMQPAPSPPPAPECGFAKAIPEPHRANSSFGTFPESPAQESCVGTQQEA